MKRISGVIFDRANGRGVRGVVVTAYDCSQGAREFDRSQPVEQMIRQLGRSLSSVMTDDRGQFALSAESLAFGGNEPRPDLALVAYAPEDVESPDTPYPRPPEERVLYMSIVPRRDVGAEEVFHIRLSRKMLEKFGLDRDTQRLAGALEARDATSDRLVELTQRERTRSEDIRARAKEATKDLSAVSPELRKHPLLAMGKGHLVKERESMQMRAIRDGLKQLVESRRPPTLRASLDEADLRRLGLLGGGEEAGTGAPATVKAEDLFAVLADKAASPRLSLERIASPVEPESLIRRYLAATAPASNKPKREDSARNADGL